MDCLSLFSQRLDIAIRNSDYKTQRDLAACLDISPAQLSRYTKLKDSDGLPSGDTLLKLALALGCSLDWLCGVDKYVKAKPSLDGLYLPKCDSSRLTVDTLFNVRDAKYILPYFLESHKLPVCLARGIGEDNYMCVDLAELGDIVVTAKARRGKSIYITRLLRQLCVARTCDDFEFMLYSGIDTSVKDYSNCIHFTRDAGQVAMFLRNTVQSLMYLRTELLRKSMCENISEYRASGQHMPYTYIVLDGMYEIMESLDKVGRTQVTQDLLTIISRGSCIGVHLIISASKQVAAELSTLVSLADVRVHLGVIEDRHDLDFTLDAESFDVYTQADFDYKLLVKVANKSGVFIGTPLDLALTEI